MTKYILKDTLDGAPVLDGIIPGIGPVTHGQPVTPYSAEMEELLKADPRFKQYRAPAESVTEPATVDDEAGKAADSKKVPAKGKE